MLAEKPLNTPASPSVLMIRNNMLSISHRRNRCSRPLTSRFVRGGGRVASPSLSPFSLAETVAEGRSSGGRACNRVLTVSRGYTALITHVSLDRLGNREVTHALAKIEPRAPDRADPNGVSCSADIEQV